MEVSNGFLCSYLSSKLKLYYHDRIPLKTPKISLYGHFIGGILSKDLYLLKIPKKNYIRALLIFAHSSALTLREN